MGRLPTDKRTEILLRRERAAKASFGVFNIGEDAVFSTFQVESGSGRMYTVQILDPLLLRNTCNCDDYARNRLGTCKHVEAVLLWLASEVGVDIWQPDAIIDTMSGPAIATGPILFFDLETRHSFDDVGGRDHMEKLEVSIAVTQREDTNEFTVYTQEQCGDLVRDLTQSQLVVGFNIIGFDYRVLAPWAHGRLEHVPTLDIMTEAVRELGHRVSLNSIASATLGEKKSGHGMEALDWWREGKIDKIIKYCQHDVELVNRLYQYGKETGTLIADTYDRGRVEFPASWGSQPTD